MHILVITLFPEMFQGHFQSSMLLKAKLNGLVDFDLLCLRDFGLGPRHQVDDSPYGGGDGMLLRVEPVSAALRAAKARLKDAATILLTPKGEVWEQHLAESFANSQKDLIFFCPHYEGYDERIVPLFDYYFSLGHFILTGGEIPALALIDSVVRLVPGVLGGPNSALIESFTNGDNLEYPQYTRPATFAGQSVPEILLSGNHAAIDAWRKQHTPKKAYQHNKALPKCPA